MLTPRYGCRPPLQARLRIHAEGRPAEGHRASSSPASSAATSTRRCSASPAPARRSPPPTSSRSCSSPTLIMAPNKTLAAQLYGEFKDLFPENAVEYFVSYYDYYQPEAYVPPATRTSRRTRSSTTQIDRMRHAATRALLSRRDVIIVASVSCIYGIGDPDYYRGLVIDLEVGQELRARRAPAPARRHPVRAQRRRLPPRHLPRARRRRRDLPRVRGRDGASASSSSATRSRASARSIRCAARSRARLEHGAHLPRLALRDAGSAAGARHRRHPDRAARAPQDSRRT